MKKFKIKLTKWFYITFSAIFILYSGFLGFDVTRDIQGDLSLMERVKTYFEFLVVDEIWIKLLFSLAFALVANFLVLFIRSEYKKA